MARKSIVLDSEKDIILKNGASAKSTYYSKYSKNCSLVIFNTKLPTISVLMKKIKNNIVKKNLEIYDNENEKIYYLLTVLFGQLLSMNNIESSKDICYKVLIDNSNNSVIRLPINSLRKIGLRDFSENDLKLIKDGESSNRWNYKLPTPLINVFRDIEVGYFDDNYKFVKDKELTKSYQQFLKHFSFPYYALQFDESSVDDAWQLREEKIVYDKERQKQIKLLKKRNRNQTISERDLDSKCAFLVGNQGAWNACMKKADIVFGMGKRGLNAYYAIKQKCDYLAANDATGLSYLCKNENRDGCIGLKAPQSTINACYQCNGSNLWLRVYAMGVVLKCY